MKKNLPTRILHLLAAVTAGATLFGLSQANAAVLADYGFEGNRNPSNVAPDVTASDASLINTLSSNGYVADARPGSAGTQSISFPGNNIGSDDSTSGTAIAFTLTLDSPQQLGTATWWIKAIKNSTNTNGVYTGSSRLFVSDDGFASTLGSSALFSSATPDASGASGPWVAGSYDLSSFGTLSGDVSFRLVLTDSSGSGSRKSLIDDISVSSPIPEPTTMGLLFGSLGVVVLFGRRRRVTC